MEIAVPKMKTEIFLDEEKALPQENLNGEENENIVAEKNNIDLSEDCKSTDEFFSDNKEAKTFSERMDKYNQAAVRNAVISMLFSFGRLISDDYTRSAFGYFQIPRNRIDSRKTASVLVRSVAQIHIHQHYGMSYQEAMLELLGGERSTALEIASVKDKNNVPPKKEFKLPDANDDMRRVFAYLTKQRFIAPDIISFFAHQHKIYEDKDHHNVVFVGTDENGVPKQASLRSTISFGSSRRNFTGPPPT